MSNTMAQSLSRSTAATFEELALLFPDVALTPEQEEAPLDVVVSVEFRGPLTGRLVLRASSCVLPVIAANMLGEEASRHVPLQRDALGELANVICGNVLPAIGGVEAIFYLAAPYVQPTDRAQSRDEDAPQATVVFGVEEGRVEASLYTFAEAHAREHEHVGAS
jgi:CheY-specific phosphatase CheX